MAGIFPDGGVAATLTSNTVDADTSCTAELFYSTSRCQPRFDPAAANAVMSELLNAINAGGITYDCTVLDNLSRAIQAMAGVQAAAAGTEINIGAMVQSSDGDVYWNCTGAAVTPAAVANITSVGLAALGFCPIGQDQQYFTSAPGNIPASPAIGSILTDDAVSGDVFQRINDGTNDVWLNISQ